MHLKAMQNKQILKKNKIKGQKKKNEREKKKKVLSK